jgi:hypothetical protein
MNYFRWWHSADSSETRLSHTERLYEQVEMKTARDFLPQLQHQELVKLSALCHYPHVKH